MYHIKHEGGYIKQSSSPLGTSRVTLRGRFDLQEPCTSQA